MLAANIICPSRSPWNFPIMLVDKKDGTKRFCTDFRKLKSISKKSSWPLPVIDDMLAALGKAKYFKTLDMKSGYWQIPLNEEDALDFAMVHLDDTIIFSALEEHKHYIQKKFDCLKQHNLKSELSKCKFVQKETKYLGFVISVECSECSARM